MRRKAREYAMQILYALDLNLEPANDFLKVFWNLHPSRSDVMDYTNWLVQGTLEKQELIDSRISAHSSHWKLDRMPATDRNILRMATYELMEESSVPHKVIIDEAIEIAKKFGTTDSASFINGVLDSIYHELAEKASPAP